MQNKTTRKISAIPHTVYRAVMIILIFAGVLSLLTCSLAMIAGGMITVPSSLLRITGHGSFIVSDLPDMCMLFFGGFLLLGGFALMLATSSRICPPAAEFVFRLIFDGKDR